MRRACSLFVGIALTCALHQACSDQPNSRDNGADAGATDCLLPTDSSCPDPFAYPSGPVHGIRDDGRVDITAEEAWPDRPPRPPLLEPLEIAEACAALAACLSIGSDALFLFDDVFTARIYLQDACPFGKLHPFDVNNAERVIPLGGGNESWDFLLRAALAARGDCVLINQAHTRRPASIECEEDGCYATKPYRVTCNGDVASFDALPSQPRDCSRSATRCSETSPTGCTDRALVRCTCGAKDRCDGDIKLGCDRCGFVTYRDCSWNGGHCEETPDRAHCVAPFDTRTCVGGGTCNGSSLSLCTAGGMVDVDCSTIAGMQCVGLSTDVEAGDGIVRISDCPSCTFALCAPCGPGCGTGGSDAGAGSGSLDGGNSLPGDAS